jgi:hypothetical protein
LEKRKGVCEDERRRRRGCERPGGGGKQRKSSTLGMHPQQAASRVMIVRTFDPVQLLILVLVLVLVLAGVLGGTEVERVTDESPVVEGR